MRTLETRAWCLQGRASFLGLHRSYVTDFQESGQMRKRIHLLLLSGESQYVLSKHSGTVDKVPPPRTAYTSPKGLFQRTTQVMLTPDSSTPVYMGVVPSKTLCIPTEPRGHPLFMNWGLFMWGQPSPFGFSSFWFLLVSSNTSHMVKGFAFGC